MRAGAETCKDATGAGPLSHLEIQACVDVGSEIEPVDRLSARVVRGRESASFQHDERWLRHPARFAVDPVCLPLGRGAFPTPPGMALFPGLSGSAPDRWGRLPMARQATLAGERRTLFEADYLLRVHDLSRQGAVRFREPETPFYAHFRGLRARAQTRCPVQGVEAPGSRGAPRAHIGTLQPPGKEASRDGSAPPRPGYS